MRSSRFYSPVLDSIFGSLQYKYSLIDKFKVRGMVGPKSRVFLSSLTVEFPFHVEFETHRTRALSSFTQD